MSGPTLAGLICHRLHPGPSAVTSRKSLWVCLTEPFLEIPPTWDALKPSWCLWCPGTVPHGCTDAHRGGPKLDVFSRGPARVGVVTSLRTPWSLLVVVVVLNQVQFPFITHKTAPN